MARKAKAGAGGGAAGAGRPPSPLGVLLPYQADWVADRSRFKIGMWSRQTGKSFATAAEAVSDCLARKTTWVTLSAGERQALEWMAKAREWATAYEAAVEDYQEVRDHAEAVLKTAEIRWGNGSRLIAIPANPDTARGYSANLTLDEFAFHEQPDAIWRAIYPSISNPLKGELCIRVVSTPNGLGNKFADLWLKEPGWSRHEVNIHQAIARGLPVDAEQLRAGLGDPEGWAQEYECQFIDSAAVLLPYDLIAKCESPEATAAVAPEFWSAPALGRGPLYLGIDFARKRDLTVCWTVEQVGDVLHTREVVELRGVDTVAQVEWLRPRLARARRVCLDYTGPGVGFGDLLAREFGEYRPEGHVFGRVELVTFTNPVKVDLFSKVRMAFDGLRVRVPVSRDIREDLHLVQRVGLAGGGVTYRAPHSKDGHADRCTALALAIRAASTGAGGAIQDASVIRYGGNAVGRGFVPRRL